VPLIFARTRQTARHTVNSRPGKHDRITIFPPAKGRANSVMRTGNRTACHCAPSRMPSTYAGEPWRWPDRGPCRSSPAPSESDHFVRSNCIRCSIISASHGQDSTAYVTVQRARCLRTVQLLPSCKDNCATAIRESRLEFTLTSSVMINAMPYKIARQDS
jgi:hypothetical protein